MNDFFRKIQQTIVDCEEDNLIIKHIIVNSEDFNNYIKPIFIETAQINDTCVYSNLDKNFCIYGIPIISSYDVPNNNIIISYKDNLPSIYRIYY